MSKNVDGDAYREGWEEVEIVRDVDEGGGSAPSVDVRRRPSPSGSSSNTQKES